LFGGLLVCIAARPEGVGTNNGLSYYGTIWQTFLPYAVALIGAALLIRRALRAMAEVFQDRRPDLAVVADWFAGMLIAVALPPYTFGPVVEWAHMIVSGLLFLLQLVISVQFVRWTDGGTPSLLLLLTELAGGLIAARYVAPKHGLLLQGQLLFQLGFAGL